MKFIDLSSDTIQQVKNHIAPNIIKIGDLIPSKTIYKEAICKAIGIENKQDKNLQGVYAFWWIGDMTELMSLNRGFKLKGIAGKDVDAEWKTEQEPPIPLYIGKTTNSQQRLRQLLELGITSENWYDEFDHSKEIAGEHLNKRTTACQFRTGMEHLYYDTKKAYDSIKENVGLSFLPIVYFQERFYLEDLAIGVLRPWFNLDSER